MLFRFRYEVAGGHTHIRVFAGVGTLGKCGDLVMRNEEWTDFKRLVSTARFTNALAYDFVDDTPAEAA